MMLRYKVENDPGIDPSVLEIREREDQEFLFLLSFHGDKRIQMIQELGEIKGK